MKRLLRVVALSISLFLMSMPICAYAKTENLPSVISITKYEEVTDVTELIRMARENTRNGIVDVFSSNVRDEDALVVKQLLEERVLSNGEVEKCYSITDIGLYNVSDNSQVLERTDGYYDTAIIVRAYITWNSESKVRLDYMTTQCIDNDPMNNIYATRLFMAIQGNPEPALEPSNYVTQTVNPYNYQVYYLYSNDYRWYDEFGGLGWLYCGSQVTFSNGAQTGNITIVIK